MKLELDHFAIQTLKDEGTYEIAPLTFDNRNRLSELQLVESFNDQSWDEGFYRALSVGPNGWHDTVMHHTGKEFVRLNPDNPNQRLDAPWYDPVMGAWNKAWVQKFQTEPEWRHKDIVWPRPGLTLNVNGATIFHESKNSPSNMATINGSDNEIHLYGWVGHQSRLILDLAPLVVNGHRNRIYGCFTGPMGGVFLNGDDNVCIDVRTWACAVGDDVAAFNVRGKRSDGKSGPNHGNRFTNCSAHQLHRQYPAEHMVGGFRLDDKTKNSRLFNCEAYGFMYGVNGNGAEYTTVDNFTSAYCGTPVALLPHHTTPSVKPMGNTVRRLQEVIA